LRYIHAINQTASLSCLIVVVVAISIRYTRTCMWVWLVPLLGRTMTLVTRLECLDASKARFSSGVPGAPSEAAALLGSLLLLSELLLLLLLLLLVELVAAVDRLET